MWPGQGLSLKVQEVLYRGRSDFQVGRRLHRMAWHSPAPPRHLCRRGALLLQDICVFKNEAYGTVLLLDGERSRSSCRSGCSAQLMAGSPAAPLRRRAAASPPAGVP
jgi:hypothetical protein